MGPIDYTQNVLTPMQSLLQGYQGGAAIRDDQLAVRQREQALLQQQAAAEQQKLMQADLNTLISNPNAGARDYAGLTVKYPQLREQLKQGWDMVSADQQKSNQDVAARTYAALTSGKADIAEKILRDRAEAMRNSGAPEQEVKAQETWADMIKASPEQARHIGGLMLSSVMGPDKFAETFGKVGAEGRAAAMAPVEMRKAEADAAIAGEKAKVAAIDAKYADQSAVLDLQKKGWDIKKITADIDLAREANRIAAMNAATSREGNSLKRQELGLKLQEARNSLDDKIRAKAAEAESGAATIDNALNTIQRIQNNKSLNDVIGSIEGRMGSIGSLLDDEESDAIALIETLGSQTFLSQIPAMKGTGNLTEKEGDKLQAALTNLGRNQSEAQFRANLNEASRLMNKARENITKKSGIPLGKPDTPAAPGARPPLSSFNQ